MFSPVNYHAVKPFWRCLVLFLAGVVASGLACPSARADDVVPRPPDAGRYEKMANRSPFAPPTPGTGSLTPVAPPPGPKWSDNLTVALITQQGGISFATIQDKVKGEHFLLQSNKEDLDHQLALASVQWGELVSQTTVTLRHNNEFASVRFDPNAAAANPAPVPGRGPAVPGTYPPAAGTPPPGRLQPPPNPPSLPGAVQRRGLIRAAPTVQSPAAAPQPPNLLRRPLDNKDNDE